MVRHRLADAPGCAVTVVELIAQSLLQVSLNITAPVSRYCLARQLFTCVARVPTSCVTLAAPTVATGTGVAIGLRGVALTGAAYCD